LTNLDHRALLTRRNAIAALLLLTAWLLAPPAPSSARAAGFASVLQRALGPLRFPAAAALRLRAGFAREAGLAGESVRLQTLALELDPADTAAVAWLAGELATQLPLAGLTTLDRQASAKAGIDVLRRARALGNRDPRLDDWEAYYWVERYAPPGSDAGARRAALDNALASLDTAVDLLAETGALDLRLHGRAALLLEERGALAAGRREGTAAAADFARAAQHERLLAARGLPGAESRAAALEARSEAAASLPR
jgi:hypothetical protein